MVQNTFPHPIPPRRVGETLGEIHLFQLHRERIHIPLSLEGERGFKDRSHPQISGYIKMYWRIGESAGLIGERLAGESSSGDTHLLTRRAATWRVSMKVLSVNHLFYQNLGLFLVVSKP